MNSSDFFSELANQMQPLFAPLAEVAQTFSQPVRARLLLVINHVIAQEPEVVKRLSVYAGRKVMFEGPVGQWLLVITPAGLFEELEKTSSTKDGVQEEKNDSDGIDLRLRVKTPDLKGVVNTLLKGQRPPVDIEGDADLAAVFAWLGENLRWDYEEDISRMMGDAPAHIVLEQLQAAVEMFRDFLESVSQRFNHSDEP